MRHEVEGEWFQKLSNEIEKDEENNKEEEKVILKRKQFDFHFANWTADEIKMREIK